MPVIPSADLEKSLRFWVEGLGLTMDRAMRQDGRLIGCMVHNEHLYFWLNQRAGTPIKPEIYEGVRLYWAPRDIHGLRARLERLGYAVSEVTDRDYGQTEFFVTDDDGYSHCFGVATTKGGKRMTDRVPPNKQLQRAVTRLRRAGRLDIPLPGRCTESRGTASTPFMLHATSWRPNAYHGHRSAAAHHEPRGLHSLL